MSVELLVRRAAWQVARSPTFLFCEAATSNVTSAEDPRDDRHDDDPADRRGGERERIAHLEPARRLPAVGGAERAGDSGDGRAEDPEDLPARHERPCGDGG